MEDKNSNTKPMNNLNQTLLNEDTLQEAIRDQKPIILLSDPEDAKEALNLFPGLFFTAPLTDDGFADEDLPDVFENAKVTILHGDNEERETLQSVYQLCANLIGTAEEVKSLSYGKSFSSFLEGFKKDPSKITFFLQNAIPYKTFKDVQKQAEANGVTITEKIDTKQLMEMIKSEHYLGIDAPPPSFLIPNFVTDKGCFFFVAGSKVGKTIILQNLALCISAGIEFLSFPYVKQTIDTEDEISVSSYPPPPHLIPVRPFNVLFLSLENEDTLIRYRFSQLIKQLGIPKDKLPNILYRQELKRMFPQIKHPVEAVEIILKKNLKNSQKGIEKKIEVVCIEPMYKLKIIDENNTKEVNELFEIAGDIADKYSVKILSCAHTKKRFTLDDTKPSEAVSGSAVAGRIGEEYYAFEQHKDFYENNNIIMAGEVRSFKQPKRRVIYFGRDEAGTDNFVYHTDPDANPFEGYLNKNKYNKATDTNPKGAGRKTDGEATTEKALDALFKAMEYADFKPVQMKDWQDHFAGSNPTLKLRKANLLNKHCIKKVGKEAYCFNFEAIEDPDLPPGWKKTLEEIKSKIPVNKQDKAQGIT